MVFSLVIDSVVDAQASRMKNGILSLPEWRSEHDCANTLAVTTPASRCCRSSLYYTSQNLSGKANQRESMGCGELEKTIKLA